MDTDSWIQLVVLLALLVASAFFSSIESAYFSLSRSVLNRLAQSSDPRARRITRLMRNPRLLLSSILTGNTIVNTTIAAISALWVIQMADTFGISSGLAVGVEVVLITLMILYFGELIP